VAMPHLTGEPWFLLRAREGVLASDKGDLDFHVRHTGVMRPLPLPA